MLIGILSLLALSLVDSTSYIVLNHGRPAGEMLVVRSADTVIVRYHHVDRQRGPRSETRYVIRNGRIEAGEIWQLPLYGPEPSPRPQPSDRFEIQRDSFVWRMRDSVRRAPRADDSWYRLRSFTAYDNLLLAQFLLGRPNRSATLLPSGTARLEIVADTVVQTARGRQRVRLAMIHGQRGNPFGVWIDDRNDLVAGESGWFITVRRGMEQALPALRAAEFAFRNRRGAEFARRLAPPRRETIAIVNGDVFDSERGVMLPRQNVIVRGDRIVAVGPASSVRVPAGAYVVDAAGKTVMPGMWDMHTHAFLLSQNTSGPAHLSIGVTSIRDLAADLDVATELRDRSARGEILAPHVMLGGFIEGPGRWAGPSEAIATTETEAREWVARYDSAGFEQVKLYNLVQQDLVPAIVDEARKRGMRVSGHVPRGMSTNAAIHLGFDEINHAAFFFSTFYPDSLYIPYMRAYSAVAQTVAPNIDVESPGMNALVELMRARRTVVDGTWNLWMSSRGPASVAVAIPPSASDSAGRRADANYLRLLKKMFDAGIPIVAGTDGSSYNAELELYERAGIPAAQVLRIATIVAASVMKKERDYGSIAGGKIADIIIVDGKPAESVAELRKITHVMRAGRLYDIKAIQAALND